MDLPATTPIELCGDSARLADQLQHGFDAPSYLRAMDAQRIDAAVLFPSMGLFVPYLPELDPKGEMQAERDHGLEAKLSYPVVYRGRNGRDARSGGYFEFTLNGKGQKQHVGSMQVELRGASAKKHQYTVALYVDDMRLEKKNKSINEPIYFYTNGSHQAMELVVNKVADKSVTGYLSMPKNMAASAKATTN